MLENEIKSSPIEEIHSLNDAKFVNFAGWSMPIQFPDGIINEHISNFDLDSVSNKPVIIKGCADEKFNKFIYSQLIQKIQGVVSSIMYGEACSSVPIFKKK